jgi:cell division protein FtsA
MIGKSQKKREILTGVEIGTSTIKVVIGEFLPDGTLKVLGCGETASLKVVKGEIADINIVTEQLEQALAEAELAAGCEIGDVFLAITGNHICNINSIGTTPVTASDKHVTDQDVVTAVRNAISYSLPPDKKVLHSLDRLYKIDNNREVDNPIGMVSGKVDADVHIIYGHSNLVETQCDLLGNVMGEAPADIAFSGVAAGLAAFLPEDAENGSLLIDIGAGVTEYVVFYGPGYFHTGQIAVGCDHACNDLSLALGLPFLKCRKILQSLGDHNGSAITNMESRARLIQVELPGKKVRNIPLSTIEQIVELRFHELFELIHKDLSLHKAFERVGNGLTLGGGGALIPGMNKLAQQVFSMPVSIAYPKMVNADEEILNSPRYLVPIGLIRWGKRMMDIAAQDPRTPLELVRGEIARVWDTVRRAFRW